jgi:hypothetical protein
MEALEEALSLVDETFPYGEANDPVLWELINQATHDEIPPTSTKTTGTAKASRPSASADVVCV